MRYEYICKHCDNLWVVEKGIKDPAPKKCPSCKGKDVERFFSPSDIPAVTYKDRPPWTYAESKKYKTAKLNDGPRIKIDPSKHGDLGSWHCSADIVKEK